MGYLEGLLGGFMGRKREYETEQLRQQEMAAQREAKVYEALINSPDDEIRTAAITGLLASTQAPVRKGGLRGWLGEMEANPAYAKIRGLVSTPVETEIPELTVTPGLPPGSTQIPTAPEPTLAQPSTAATQGGPLAAPEAAPRPGPAVAPGVGTPPSIAVSAGIPGTPPTGGPPATTTRRVSQPRRVFLTPEEATLQQYSARERGEILGVVAAYKAVGVPHAEAVQRAIAERERARGGGAADRSIFGEILQPDGTWRSGSVVFDPQSGKHFDTQSGQPVLGFRRNTTVGSASQPTDARRIMQEMFPGKALNELTGEEAARLNAAVAAYGGTKAAATTMGRGEAAAVVPLTAQNRPGVVANLAKQWTEASASRNEMQRQYGLMQTGLQRYDADPIGGSQAVLVTFQKILDPTSVVRESEYARSPQGLSLMGWLEGMYERYKTGGAGVPKEVLAEMVKTAEVFLRDENMRSALDNVRARLAASAARSQIDPIEVFGPADMPKPGVGTSPAVGAPPPGARPAGGAAPPAAGPGPDWQMIGGVLHYKGKPYQ